MNTLTQGTLIEHYEDYYRIPELRYFYVLDIPSAGILKAEVQGAVASPVPFISESEYAGEIPDGRPIGLYSEGIG